MKSLEIVNKALEEKENECYKAYGIFLEKQIKELRQIKADLEVLEVLKKHLWIEDDYVCVSDYLRNAYYEEDFIKVQQWLEGNQ